MFEQTHSATPRVIIHPMEYRAIVAPEATLLRTLSETAPDPAELEVRIRELEREIEENSHSFDSRLQSARMEAYEEGRNMECGERAALLTATAQALTSALQDFTAERDRYLTQVEEEVVRLALAIAARILRRESLMDPLLLAGAVRVALSQLAETTEVRLKVPASEHEMWREMFRLMPSLPLYPEVLAEDALTTGECLLETHLGSIDLGVRSQLAEIERGFFDLLENRQPREKPESGKSVISRLRQSGD